MQIKINNDSAIIYNDNYVGKYSYIRFIFIFVLGLIYFIFRQASSLLIGTYVLAFLLLVLGSFYTSKYGALRKTYTIEYDKNSKIYNIKDEFIQINLPSNNKLLESNIDYLNWQQNFLYEILSIKTKKEKLTYQLNGNTRNANFKEDEVKQLANFLGTKLK
mgnify:FL=1|jgi:hypothetical protein